MSTHTILTLIEDNIILLQLLHHVVGIEHGYDGTLAYTLATQLSYVGVRDGENASRTKTSSCQLTH